MCVMFVLLRVIILCVSVCVCVMCVLLRVIIVCECVCVMFVLLRVIIADEPLSARGSKVSAFSFSLVSSTKFRTETPQNSQVTNNSKSLNTTTLCEPVRPSGKALGW